jgi:2-polyprenyl-6-hydroxyphenyl methylase/3-demethylubiquinone-9 3-methyltransferase
LNESFFDKISSEWWDKNGPMKMLHSMNETRMLFIKERIINKYQKLGSLKKILEKKLILDLGCGGGILSETLAEQGANIVAIDQSKKLINEAKKRAKSKKLKIDYQCQSIKSLKSKNTKFDIILCMEVVEHVQGYRSFIKLAFECLKKDGIIIFSTINKSFLSYLTTIFLAEKVLKLVPSKTHNWDMYVKPEEILEVAEKFSFKLDKIKGLAAIPSLQGFKWIRINNTKANYIISIIN